MLALVAIIPYLLNNVEFVNQTLSAADSSQIRDYSSSLFAIDLAGILAILAIFSHVISIEEKNLVTPEIARVFRQSRTVQATLAVTHDRFARTFFLGEHRSWDSPPTVHLARSRIRLLDTQVPPVVISGTGFRFKNIWTRCKRSALFADDQFRQIVGRFHRVFVLGLQPFHSIPRLAQRAFGLAALEGWIRDLYVFSFVVRAFDVL